MKLKFEDNKILVYQCQQTQKLERSSLYMFCPSKCVHKKIFSFQRLILLCCKNYSNTLQEIRSCLCAVFTTIISPSSVLQQPVNNKINDRYRT